MTRRVSIKRSPTAATIYRKTAGSWLAAQDAGLVEPLEARAHVAACHRAALGQELVVELVLGRLTHDELLIAQRLLPTWHGRLLSEVVDVVRAVS